MARSIPSRGLWACLDSTVVKCGDTGNRSSIKRRNHTSAYIVVDEGSQLYHNSINASNKLKCTNSHSQRYLYYTNNSDICLQYKQSSLLGCLHRWSWRRSLQCLLQLLRRIHKMVGPNTVLATLPAWVIRFRPRSWGDPCTILFNFQGVLTTLDTEESQLSPKFTPRVTYDPVLEVLLLVVSPSNDRDDVVGVRRGVLCDNATIVCSSVHITHACCISLISGRREVQEYTGLQAKDLMLYPLSLLNLTGLFGANKIITTGQTLCKVRTG